MPHQLKNATSITNATLLALQKMKKKKKLLINKNVPFFKYWTDQNNNNKF